MSLLYSFLTTVFLMLPMQDGKKLMIMDMNSNYVLIDSKVMKIGDVFMEGANVWWCFKGQTMDVMDVNTSKMYKFSAVNNHKTSATREDFWGLEKPLSTNDRDSMAISSETPAHLYVSYRENGQHKREVLNLNMDLEALPTALSLYRYDPKENADMLMTEDFRGFVDSLVDAHKMAKDEIEKTDYYEGEEEKARKDYMKLMKRYTPSRYKSIEYTYNELKLLLKL